jgi:hypothetical protein
MSPGSAAEAEVSMQPNAVRLEVTPFPTVLFSTRPSSESLKTIRLGRPILPLAIPQPIPTGTSPIRNRNNLKHLCFMHKYVHTHPYIKMFLQEHYSQTADMFLQEHFTHPPARLR